MSATKDLRDPKASPALSETTPTVPSIAVTRAANDGSRAIATCEYVDRAVAGGGGGAVSSVFTRTGAILAQTGDYTVGMITNAESVLNKNANSGYAGLSSSGLLLSTLFPALTGDITTPGGTLATTLKNTGTAGTYTKVTTDAQGRVASGTTLSAGDIPNIAESQVTGLVSDLAACEKTANKDRASGYAGLDASVLLNAAEFPAPTSSTFGGVKSLAAVAKNFLTSIGTNGIPVAAQPLLSDLGSPSGNTSFTMTGDSLTFNWATNSFVFDTSGNALHGLVSFTTAVVSSPTLTIAGSYQSAGTPTFAEDSWTLQDVVGSGTNGISTLTLTHAGSTGAARFQIPVNALAGGPGLLFAGTNNTGIGSVASSQFDFFSQNNGASAPFLNFNFWTGAAYSKGWFMQFTQSGGSAADCALQGNGATAQLIGLYGVGGTTANITGVRLGGNGGNNGHNFTGTSGSQWAVAVGGTGGAGLVQFSPASGSCSFAALMVNPNILTSGTYSGVIRNLASYPALGGVVGATVYLIAAGTASSSSTLAALTDKFTVDSSGNVVAQGTYAVGANVGVSVGPITALTSITTTGGIVTALSGTSDERLKNYEAYRGGLDEILQINPVRHTWNEQGAKITGLSREQSFVGFLAQDVQKVIPEAITSKTADGFLNLDDRPIIAALVNAVKELTARIAVLEARPRSSNRTVRQF